MGVKSRVIRANVCQHCLRAHVLSACQLLTCMCQRASKRANLPKGCQFFNFACQKAFQFFHYFSKKCFIWIWIFQLCSTFAKFKNIWSILENLSRETKNLNFGISKISLKKNLLRFLTSFSMDHVGLTEQLFG